MISTLQLAFKDLDTVLVHDGEVVYLYGVTRQTDGGYCVELGYTDAGGGRYTVAVDAQDVHEPMWDYDDNDN